FHFLFLCFFYLSCFFSVDRFFSFLEIFQRLSYSADVQVFIDAEDFFCHCVHICAAGAHFVDDLVDIILKLHRLVSVPCFDQIIQFQEQSRHYAVGSADSAVCSDGTACYELFVGSVKYHEISLCCFSCCLEHLDVLGRHGGILYRYHSGVFHHFSKQAHGQCCTCQLRNVVDYKVCIRRCCADGIPVCG